MGEEVKYYVHYADCERASERETVFFSRLRWTWIILFATWHRTSNQLQCTHAGPEFSVILPHPRS